MVEQQKNETLEPSQEELNAEKEMTSEVSEDELRDKLAEEMELDPEDEADKKILDKLIAKEKGHREKLSGAIKQKINYRTKFQEATSKKPDGKPPEGNDPQKKVLTEDEFEIKFNKRMEEERLKEMNLPEEIEEKVRTLANVKGISVREAAKDPYIQFEKEKKEKEERLLNATPKNKKNGSHSTSYDPSQPLDPKNYDMSTKEGQDAWERDKKAHHEYKKNNP